MASYPVRLSPEILVSRLLRRAVPAAEYAVASLDLEATPGRVARAWAHELLAGYHPGALEALARKFTTFDSDSTSLVTSGPFDYYSMCSHHLLPFYGQAWIGYVPNGRVVGASKPARALEFFSRKLQIQERLVEEWTDFIHAKTGALFTIGIIRGIHLCMACRGVRQAHGSMVTTAIRPSEYAEYRGVIDEFYRTVNFTR